jgi:AcrR family transcriptional regulator
MGHRHTKEEILAGALAAAFADGLSQLTFGRVAKKLGISDRIVVYYFPTKDDLIGEVLVAMGTQLQQTLAPTFASPAADYIELLRSAWPILAQPDADPIFALFFEASGLAATGIEPYSAFVRGTPARRRTEAETAIAVLDGLLLLRQVAGPAAADRVAKRLGVRGTVTGAVRRTDASRPARRAT